MGKKKAPKVNENEIILKFWDFICHPDDITKTLNLKPCSAEIKGEVYLKGNITHPPMIKVREHSHWKYKEAYSTNEDIMLIIEKFIDAIIVPRKNAIKKISSKSKLNFEIVQYYYDGCNPEFWIDSKYAKILADINCTIWIDLYCLSGE